MDLQNAIKVVDKFLGTLRHTGVSGFEGLVAYLLQRAACQEFRLSSSGRQSGRDAASESGYANSIKVEAKHYSKTTPLDLRELIAEIDEAAESDKNLDIWVLAASLPVDDQIATSLDEHAETYGVEVVVLDLGISGLPRLAILMAAFSDAVVDWADQHQLREKIEEVRAALAVIVEAPDFGPARSRLIAKLAGTTGYDGARRRINKQLLATLSDKQKAHSVFRQPLGIRASGAQLIRRVGLNKQFDEWWEATGFPAPAVALGEEGTGKTWAVFDWAIERLERGDMPIVLPFAAVAQQLSNSEPLEALLPHLLAKWTGILDDIRWKRRLDRWLIGESTGRPLVLLIADGLNERADVEWRPFFSILLSDPWRDRIAVLATERPHHWRVRCQMARLAAIREITVEGYSHVELDQALSGSQVSFSQIPPELMPLISIPRYCRLVADHYQEMIDAADFTRERLIYIEIKDRYESKLQYPLTDERFFEIIRDLAEHARNNPVLNPRDLRSLIAVPGGDEANIYEEIVSGGLLVEVPRSGMVSAFRVEPLRLIYGFGMLLAQDLAELSSASGVEIEEFLTSWFEPQPDMDRKVEICGSALFHALFQNDFSQVPLRELVRYWLGLRNWADTSQSAFTKYVLRRPEIFIQVAEAFWSAERDSAGAQQFLGAAFAANRDDPKVQLLLTRAIERWMGFVHPLGRRFSEFGHPRPNEVGKEERVRKEIETRAGCPVVPGEIEVAGVKLTVLSDGFLLRLARFGLMIMSAGDPTPFIDSLGHWAVASAIMDDTEFSDLVSWVIHLAEWDVDTAVVGEARRLLARNEPIALAAAQSLLYVIGSKEANDLIEEHDLTPDWYKQRRKQHASDPCTSLYSWAENEVIPCLGREDVPLHMILERATLPIVDPSIELPASLIRRAKEVLRSIPPTMIRGHSGPTIEDHKLKTLTSILCARAPSELADFMRGVVRTMPHRNTEGQYFLAITLPKLALLLRADEIQVVSRANADLSANASEWSSKDQSGDPRTKKIAEAFAFSAIAPHLSSSDFFRCFISRPVKAWDLVSLEMWFAPIEPDQAREVIKLLHTPPDHKTLRRILWMLPYLKITLSELERSRLEQLVTSEDAKTRSGAARAVVIIQDQSLGRRIIDRGISADKDAEPWEELWLTLLLGKFADHLSFEDLAKRLRPSAISFVIEQRGSRPDEIAKYANSLDQDWQQIMLAVDPDIEPLPEMRMYTDHKHIGARLPDLEEPGTQHTIHLGRSSSWTSGPTVDQPAELEEFFNTDTEEKARKMNQAMHRKIDAISAAWRTVAFQWLGRDFSPQTMDRVYEQSPTLVERWGQSALSDSPTGRSARMRLGTLLEPICLVLLNRNSQLGFKLWKVLHKREDNPVVIDTVDIAFTAQASYEARLARQVVLDECWNDTSIARVAYSCGRSGREDWLEEVIMDLISAKRLWRRAKGLTLASFSDITQGRFEELVSMAAIADSWVEENLASLRENVRKNRLARHWYSVFLAAEDSDAAWGALRIVLSLADERLLNWRKEVEKACADSKRVETRLRFLELGWSRKRELPEEIDRENARKEHLFGIKIQPGEIVPFM